MQLRRQLPVKLLAEEDVGDLEAEVGFVVGVVVGAGRCPLAARVQVQTKTGAWTASMTTTNTSRPLQGFLQASLLL